MARRRKKRSTGSRRGRRRMSGVGKDEMTTAVGVLLGAAGAMIANNELSKMTKPVDPKILAVGELLLGFFGPRFVKGPLVKGIGYGLMAAGGSAALKEFDVLNGLPLISGYKSMNVINGVPDIVQQYMPKKDGSSRQYSTAETLAGMGMFN